MKNQTNKQKKKKKHEGEKKHQKLVKSSFYATGRKFGTIYIIWFCFCFVVVSFIPIDFDLIRRRNNDEDDDFVLAKITTDYKQNEK